MLIRAYIKDNPRVRTRMGMWGDHRVGYRLLGGSLKTTEVAGAGMLCKGFYDGLILFWK